MRFTLVALIVTIAVTTAPELFGWNNGQQGNSTTNTVAECTSPPYATHDWIADHALALLTQEERQWIEPHKTMYLLGTETPGHKPIPSAAVLQITATTTAPSSRSLKGISSGKGCAAL